MLRSSTLTQSVTVTGVRHSHRQCFQTIPVSYRFCDATRNTLFSNSTIFKFNTNANRYNNRSNNRYGMQTVTTRATAQPLQNADELIDSVETFIFDCDGMLLILPPNGNICIISVLVRFLEEFHFYTLLHLKIVTLGNI